MPPDYRGRTVGGYRLDDLLGSGATGLVYRAHDPRLDREVAIKLLEATSCEPRTLERFGREGRAAARIDDEHVARVFDQGVDGALHYLVQELVAGESLNARLDREERLEVAEVLRLGMAIAAGLAAIHRAGVLHRDLKPENVILTPEGQAKIVDFGIAREENSQTKRLTGKAAILGTPRTMSPEQLQEGGGAATAKSDVFGLGAMLHMALTGLAPHEVEEGESIAALLGRRMSQPAEDVRTLRADVPAALAELLARSLEQDPAGRPTAEEMGRELSDLRRLSRAAPPRAAPVGPPRELLIAAAGGVLLLVIALGFALSDGQRVSPEEARSGGTRAGDALGKPAEALPADEPLVDEPPLEVLPAEEPPAKEPPAEELPVAVEEPPAEEPPTEEDRAGSIDLDAELVEVFRKMVSTPRAALAALTALDRRVQASGELGQFSQAEQDAWSGLTELINSALRGLDPRTGGIERRLHLARVRAAPDASPGGAPLEGSLGALVRTHREALLAALEFLELANRDVRQGNAGAYRWRLDAIVELESKELVRLLFLLALNVDQPSDEFRRKLQARGGLDQVLERLRPTVIGWSAVEYLGDVEKILRFRREHPRLGHATSVFAGGAARWKVGQNPGPYLGKRIRVIEEEGFAEELEMAASRGLVFLLAEPNLEAPIRVRIGTEWIQASRGGVRVSGNSVLERFDLGRIFVVEHLGQDRVLLQGIGVIGGKAKLNREHVLTLPRIDDEPRGRFGLGRWPQGVKSVHLVTDLR